MITLGPSILKRFGFLEDVVSSRFMGWANYSGGSFPRLPLPKFMRFNKQHPVQPPKFGSPNDRSVDFVAKLYAIEPVHIEFVCDNDEKPHVVMKNPNSSDLLRALHKANLERWTVTVLVVSGNPVPHQCLARLNWFLHIHGYTKGFRGWKRANEKKDGGATLWKSNLCWDELKQIIGLRE